MLHPLQSTRMGSIFETVGNWFRVAGLRACPLPAGRTAAVNQPALTALASGLRKLEGGQRARATDATTVFQTVQVEKRCPMAELVAPRVDDLCQSPAARAVVKGAAPTGENRWALEEEEETGARWPEVPVEGVLRACPRLAQEPCAA